MKLKTKLFLITDSTGEEIDVENKDAILMLNGQKTSSRIPDVFTDTEYDEGEIYGNSLLSYYQVQEDGSLEVEGSKIQFALESGEPILVKRILRPDVNDDTIIPFEHVQKFAEFFAIAKPEEVFVNLNEDEKQVFISSRNEKVWVAKQKADEEENARTEQAKKEKEKSDAEKAKQAKEAEAKLKASINPRFVSEKKDYISEQSFYRGIDFKEYIHPPYHLFYGKSDDEMPKVFIKRGETWWEETKDADIIDENDKTVVIEFTDGHTAKQLTLDIASGEIKITDAEA